MKNRTKLLTYGVMILCAFIYFKYIFFKNPEWQNDRICATKRLAIKGVITGERSSNSYHYITVDNIEKPLMVSISGTKSYTGFTEDYTYKIGDSIIKAADSGEFTIKNGDKVIVQILNCED